MPRTRQPSAGSTTTRSPAAKPELSSVTVPTISCPIVNGGLVIGEKYGEFSERSVPRSEPQIPDTLGLTRTHSGVGRGGSPTLSSWSGENRPVSTPRARFEAKRMRRYFGTDFL